MLLFPIISLSQKGRAPSTRRETQQVSLFVCRLHLLTGIKQSLLGNIITQLWIERKACLHSKNKMNTYMENTLTCFEQRQLTSPGNYDLKDQPGIYSLVTVSSQPYLFNTQLLSGLLKPSGKSHWPTRQRNRETQRTRRAPPPRATVPSRKLESSHSSSLGREFYSLLLEKGSDAFPCPS